MATWIHFIFELFKISIQAFVYGTILWGFVITLDKLVKNKLRDVWDKILSGALSIMLVWVFLFVYMFSYWGAHGLGDFARIPVGHYEAVEAVDGGPAFNGFSIGNFTWNSRILVTDHGDKILVYDLATGETVKCSKNEYLKVAQRHQWPKPDQFKSFHDNYQSYWGGWRFWLLP